MRTVKQAVQRLNSLHPWRFSRSDRIKPVPQLDSLPVLDKHGKQDIRIISHISLTSLLLDWYWNTKGNLRIILLFSVVGQTNSYGSERPALVGQSWGKTNNALKRNYRKSRVSVYQMMLLGISHLQKECPDTLVTLFFFFFFLKPKLFQNG